MAKAADTQVRKTPYRHDLGDSYIHDLPGELEAYHPHTGPTMCGPTWQAEVGEGEAYNAIVLDPDKCIKCGRCVTVCQEVQGVGMSACRPS